MRTSLKELGVRIGRLPSGPTDSLVDVPGFQVGHVTLMAGEGALHVGHGPVRTGVTAIVPPNPLTAKPAAVHVINGYGKSTGLMQIQELGTIESPIFLTNTLGVGAVLQGYLQHLRDTGAYQAGTSRNVVVAECNDGFLNDLWGLHVQPEHAVRALAEARSSPPCQGSVGAGTGMAGYGHKGGIGTASRRLTDGSVLASLVLLNCGTARDLVRNVAAPAPPPELPDGSIIMILATNRGVDRWDLTRVARRAAHGLARTGTYSAPGSGDVVVAVDVGPAQGTVDRTALNELFLAAAEATEAAIWNALLAAETMVGRDGHRLAALPVSWVLGSGTG